MVSIPKIQSSTYYKLFKQQTKNREIIPSHVEKLKKDPTFPEKFPTCPIIVDKDHYIIDGQHRYLAAIGLEIPIYYIVDENASDEDIKIRNAQMHGWKGKDFYQFYSHTSKSYKFIVEMRNKHQVTYSFINAVIMKMCGYRKYSFSYDMRAGKINIEKHIDKIFQFLDDYVPIIKECKKIKGKKADPLFSNAYITGFCHFFVHEKNIFEKAMKKLLVCSSDFAYTSKYEDARTYIKAICNWKRPKINGELECNS